MEAVLPLKISPHKRPHSLLGAWMLCQSLSHFWRGASPLVLTVMCPQSDLAAIRDALSPSPPCLELHFVAETQLVPTLDENPAFPGWMRQQVLKLAVFSLVRSDFYLCLDSDILCVRPIDSDLLLPGGKAMTDYASARQAHAPWWLASAALLGVDAELDRPGMRVTPAILSRAIVAGLHRSLSPAHGVPWGPLIRAGNGPNPAWTEYCLYNLFADNAGLMDRDHLSYKEFRALGRQLINGKSVWSEEDLHAWDPAQLFDEREKGLFAVVQSITRPPLEEIWPRFRQHLLRFRA
jgi:hypothetical protein